MATPCDEPYFVVLLDPSIRASLSIVMAWAGQIASHSLQAIERANDEQVGLERKLVACISDLCNVLHRWGNDAKHVHLGIEETEGLSQKGT